MAYITRNANILLLFLILISASALVAATVFFQTNFDRLNRAYDNKLAQLAEVTTDLEQKQAALEQIKNELTLKSAREEEFTQQYTTVRGEKTKLESEKQELTRLNVGLEKEIADTQSALQTIQNQLEATLGENERIKADLTEANANINALRKKIDDYKAAIDAKDAKITCLQTKPDVEESTC
jgi:chromosome segregation ATPase